MTVNASSDSFKAEGVGVVPPHSCHTGSPLSLSTPWRLESVLAVRGVQSLRPYPAPDALAHPKADLPAKIGPAASRPGWD